ncbi:tetratricopeptide repeat protein [Candidatus Gottesmanbacteria bacterium]|nr:tetratricopeptide repeat protein [Candidatus Gottesmanbacteria bacterium]
MHDSTSIAIQAALTHDWEKAIELNQEILKDNKNDISTLNRLGYAYTQLGELEEARRLYRKILALDKYNLIAQKNLERINTLFKTKKRGNRKKSQHNSLSPGLFIEEPGKTKTVHLINIAPANFTSHLDIGDIVSLCPKKHSIEVRDGDNTYIGALPDDISFRLLRFLQAGNTYQVCIKNVEKRNVSIFIREIKRGKRFSTQPTFTTSLADLRVNAGLRDQENSGTEEENQEVSEE